MTKYVSLFSRKGFVLSGAVGMCLCLGVLGVRAQDIPGDLVRNGSFALDVNGDGCPDGWSKGKGLTIEREGDRVWLRLDGSHSTTGQRVILKPEWARLRLTMRMRTTGIVLGKEGWQNGRLAMSFHDAKGTRIGDWPNVFSATGTTDWIDCDRLYRIPRGAAYLQLGPGNFGSAGRVEFESIRIVVAGERVMHKSDAPLPLGITDPWSMTKAWRRTSPTRETICMNALWRFRPILAEENADVLPAAGDCWGWFKVPGIWPASAEADAEVPQRVLVAPFLAEILNFAKVDQAWYQREIVVPKAWAGRRVLLDFTMLQTHARVLVDGKEAGEVWFPGGTVDLSKHVSPGQKHVLSVCVTARPLEKESTVFMAPDRAFKSKATVGLKGITGDVFLVSEPRGKAISDVHVITSTRKRTVTLDVGLRGDEARELAMEGRIMGAGRLVRRLPRKSLEVKHGRISATYSWADAKLWDTDTPGNMYEVVVTVLDSASGQVIDESLPVRFGFREFWIEGRDFMLNGRRIHLRALHNRTINGPADKACFAGALNTCRRMQEYGFNFLITANYHFQPGAVGYMDGLFSAADETGMLTSFALPHCKDFNWKLDSAEQRERYTQLSQWLIRRVQNHPSAIMYAMNHNSTGYYGDQNPLKIDGIYDPDTITDRLGYKGSSYRTRTRKQARLAAEIAKSIDPTRPVYHHQSGNLGEMHTVNIYLNWAPRQERSDWLEHWGAKGTKPLFFVEWGLPHISSWSSYRGPRFIWRCEAFQQLWDSEFAAAIIGEDAYAMTEGKKRAIDIEERLWGRGEPFHWGKLNAGIRGIEATHFAIKTWFADDNWRAHRTWGISAMLPWDQGDLWRRVNPTPRTANHAALTGLQEPGIVPDMVFEGRQYVSDQGKGSYEPTSIGRSFLRWNQPLLAYIGGGPTRFTSKDHVYVLGELVEKQLVIVNDTRRTRRCAYVCSSKLDGWADHGKVKVAPGGVRFVPLRFRIDHKAASPTTHVIEARFSFDDGSEQRDSFEFRLLAPADPATLSGRIALYDPVGKTGKLLKRLGVKSHAVESQTDLSSYDLVIIGREALSGRTPCPVLSRVREGMSVLVFEQTAQTLERRLGFRMNLHGMRRAFVRSPSHPALAGLSEEHLRNWRGAATLTAPHLETAPIEAGNPKWEWCGFRNTRVWRCGNVGSVASALIEKPPKGNWLPLVDCGFDLQYAPLLEYREGAGRVVFCQLDVTDRAEADPVADRICLNLVRYASSSVDVVPERTVTYVGDPKGRELLSGLGVACETGIASAGPQACIVVGPGSRDLSVVRQRVAAGGIAIGLGLSREEIVALAGAGFETKEGMAYSTTAKSLDHPLLAGISNADLHWRTPLEVITLTGESRVGNTALRVIAVGQGHIVLCQPTPWMFDTTEKPYTRTTYRRTVFLVSRLLANAGVRSATALLTNLATPAVPHSLALAGPWVGQVDREDIGRDDGWWKPDFDDAAWKPIAVPGPPFDEQRADLKGYNGHFWYRVRFLAPEHVKLDELKLHLGPVDDESWVWLNGHFLGEVTKKTNPKDYWAFPRVFDMTPELLNTRGDNVLVVRVNDTYQTGGLTGEPRFECPPPWLESYYVQTPEAGDDPYRYYRW